MTEDATTTETETGTTEDTGESQGQVAEGTTETGSQEDVIYDPKEFDRLIDGLPDELKSQAGALRKSLQGSYTKKTQAIADARKKIEAYDAFYKDPESQIRQMAQQLGLTVTKQGQVQENSEDWEPKSWDDVMTKAEQRIFERLSPLLNEVRTIKKASIESQLDELDDSWREYEDEMSQTLREHPTLYKDPVKLYRMSVPPEVFESRAVQKAIKKLEQKANTSKISGSSTTTKQPATGVPDKSMTFDEAVKYAKASLAEQGIKPGA